jgi:hypothetical protein
VLTASDHWNQSTSAYSHRIHGGKVLLYSPAEYNRIYILSTHHKTVSGCTSMRDANPGLDNQAMSLVWACAGRGAVGREDDLAVCIGCTNGCINDPVVDVVDHGHLRAMISY